MVTGGTLAMGLALSSCGEQQQDGASSSSGGAIEEEKVQATQVELATPNGMKAVRSV